MIMLMDDSRRLRGARVGRELLPRWIVALITRVVTGADNESPLLTGISH
jgi:hypothetical protein